MFSTRQLRHEDYDVIKPWWEWFRFPVVSREALPDNGTCGIMVSKNGVDVCAGFLYLTNSSLCWIEFVVSNPEYREKDRQEAITFLIDRLCNDAKNFGCMLAFTSVKNENLINRFKEAGFEIRQASECYKSL